MPRWRRGRWIRPWEPKHGYAYTTNVIRRDHEGDLVCEDGFCIPMSELTPRCREWVERWDFERHGMSRLKLRVSAKILEVPLPAKYREHNLP